MSKPMLLIGQDETSRDCLFKQWTIQIVDFDNFRATFPWHTDPQLANIYKGTSKLGS